MDIAHLIQTSVAPVFLLSGVAATLGVLTNRLARVVDRARSIEAKLEHHTGNPEHFKYDLEILVRRAGYLNAAISFCVVSAVLVALVVVTLFANAFFEARLALTIALLFVGSMLFVTGAFVAFFIEVRLASTALRIGLPRSGA
jgi:Protein of unknown function (DUF2721)